jgi:hypothetical protein
MSLDARTDLTGGENQKKKILFKLNVEQKF